MDASQYKDYVLVLLFVKYVSDKYAGVPFAPITIPEGASFKDKVALKGKPDIGDQINKKIIGPLANANKLSDMPDFADATKLGSGKEMVDRLTNLIAIFESPALDFGHPAGRSSTLRVRVAYMGAKLGSATMTSWPSPSKQRATHSLSVEASITIRSSISSPSSARIQI